MLHDGMPPASSHRTPVDDMRTYAGRHYLPCIHNWYVMEADVYPTPDGDAPDSNIRFHDRLYECLLRKFPDNM
jgi:hypothetical protein